MLGAAAAGTGLILVGASAFGSTLFLAGWLKYATYGTVASCRGQSYLERRRVQERDVPDTSAVLGTAPRVIPPSIANAGAFFSQLAARFPKR